MVMISYKVWVWEESMVIQMVIKTLINISQTIHKAVA